LDFDKQLEMFGEILACKTSRDMLFLLSRQELYHAEIINKLNIRSSLTSHHLAKLQKLGLVIARHKPIAPRKNPNPHIFYKTDPKIIIKLKTMFGVQ